MTFLVLLFWISTIHVTIYTGHSQAVLSRVNRRRKAVRLISVRLSYCQHWTYVMSLATELSAVVICQYVHPILILVIFFSSGAV
jgi:hypothetical protein